VQLPIEKHAGTCRPELIEGAGPAEIEYRTALGRSTDFVELNGPQGVTRHCGRFGKNSLLADAAHKRAQQSKRDEQDLRLAHGSVQIPADEAMQ